MEHGLKYIAYYVKTHITFRVAGSRQAARGARICETGQAKSLLKRGEGLSKCTLYFICIFYTYAICHHGWIFHDFKHFRKCISFSKYIDHVDTEFIAMTS